MVDYCQTGKDLWHKWIDNYNAVVRSGGDWLHALCDRKEFNTHVKTCRTCTTKVKYDYSKVKRETRLSKRAKYQKG